MLLIRGAQQLVTMRGPSPRRGAGMADLGIIADGAVLIDGDRIDEVGPTRRLENLAKARGFRVIDATGKVVLPGLVDAHTRLLFQRFPTWGPAEVDDGSQFGIAEILMARQARSSRALRAATRRWTYDKCGGASGRCAGNGPQRLAGSASAIGRHHTDERGAGGFDIRR
jgi:imidazolonepropionase-like amidohydrolase